MAAGEGAVTGCYFKFTVARENDLPKPEPERKYLTIVDTVRYNPIITIFTVQDAKSNLPELLARMEAGEEIVLARGAQPVARLMPVIPRAEKRQFGALRGQFSVGPEFFEPLPAAELASRE